MYHNRILANKHQETMGHVHSFSHRPYYWLTTDTPISSFVPGPIFHHPTASEAHLLGGIIALSYYWHGQTAGSLAGCLLSDRDSQAMGPLWTNPERPWGAFFHSLMDPFTDSPLTCRHLALFLAPSSISLTASEAHLLGSIIALSLFTSVGERLGQDGGVKWRGACGQGPGISGQQDPERWCVHAFSYISCHWRPAVFLACP